MIELLCCVYDVVALVLGGVVVWRQPWRGGAREVVLLGAVAVLALVAIAVPARALGGFALLRGLCHGLFCVVLPLLLVRAVRLRRAAPSFATALALVFATGEACYVWAREVEPFRLEVTTARATTARLAGLATPLRVAVVADLQTDAIGAYEVAVFDRLVAAAPDLVLYAGDYLQVGSPAFGRELPKLHAQLARLAPRLGSFAVDGDVDVGGARAVFAGTSVRVLVDEHAAVPGVPIDVIGLSRARSRAPFVDAGVVRRLGGGRYPIVLGHAPDFMLSVVRDGLATDALMVAGHTHGGQIQVPWLGPILTLSAVPRWLAGGGVHRRGDTWLVCSRGIGMERSDAPRIRFLCRPQLILLELAAK
jgi:predicted MPP superfamily phosphohydrolase